MSNDHIKPTQHRMGRRAYSHDYTRPGIYHITIHVADTVGSPFGTVVGRADAPDGSADAPRVVLTAVGRMVEHELLHSIHAHYAMITVQDYVVMPDHLHCLLVVQDKILSANGKTLALGHVIAGFKQGCNRLYWQLLTPQSAPQTTPQQVDPAATPPASTAAGRVSAGSAGGAAPARSCSPAPAAPQDPFAALCARLLIGAKGTIVCDTFGDRTLLARPLLPVVCHRRDVRRRDAQRRRCLDAARQGTVLVSARIAADERSITDEALALGFPVVLVADNGFSNRYHPSADRLALCAAGRLLLVSPWHYLYRRAGETIHVPLCKTMNCVAQALCRRRDDWWQT